MDIILYNIIAAIACLILGYLFGSFPTAIIIGKVFYKQDPREFGSKNAGGTNAARLWGKKVGAIVIIIDMIKTLSPIYICWAILTFVPFGDKPLMADSMSRFAGLDTGYVVRWSAYWLASLGASLGHCYPLFANFKGGKGAASGMGTWCTTSWCLGLIPAVGIYYLILKIKRYMSLGSIIIPFIITFLYATWSVLCLTKVVAGYETFVSFGNTLAIDWVAAIVLFLQGILIVIRHSENIKRLKNHTENKTYWVK